ncbi:MAG: PKD domain-containing protein [Acidobacteriota bacterium]
MALTCSLPGKTALLAMFVLASTILQPAVLRADEPGATASLSVGAPTSHPPGPHGLAAIRSALATTGLHRGARTLRLALPDGSSVELERTQLERRGPDSITWRGRVIGQEEGDTTLTLVDGLVFGRLQVGARTYELRSRRGLGLVIEELAMGSFPPCDGGRRVPKQGLRQDSAERPEAVIGGGIDLDSFGETGTPRTEGCDDADSKVVIDLLVVYSTEALAWAGGVAEIEALAQASVDNSNSAFINSDMSLRYRLVHVAPVAYSTGGDTSTDLDFVEADPTVAMLRDAYGADMVSILVDTPDSCGNGNVQRSPGLGFEDDAFQATDVDCAVGNMTFAHEHGHNLGMEHNPEDTDTTTTEASLPWSFGHYENGVFRTVMSYSAQCTIRCPRTAHYSSPAHFQDGLPVGLDGARHNALTGELTGPAVALFRPTVVPHVRTPGVVEARIAFDRDDVEEALASGVIDPESSDMELGEDGEAQAVGLRFVGLYIPQGATVTSAYLEFVVDEADTAPTDVVIRAQAADDAPVFNTLPGDLTSRSLTSAMSPWSIPPWETIGSVERSPDVSSVVQEVVDRDGWASGNSLAFVITGTGSRTAEAYDDAPTLAPFLHVEFTTPPTADFSHVVEALRVVFSDASTDCDGDIVSWEWDFGDGNDSTDPNPSHDYEEARTYTVTLTVTDDDGATDTVTFEVTPGTGVIDRRIAVGSDDVEENLTSGNVDFDSTDIELVEDTGRGRSQVIGLRFVDLPLPRDAVIDAAHLVFTVDEPTSGATDLEIRAEATDDARPFEDVADDVSTRPLGSDSVSWSVPAWDTALIEHQSPELVTLIEEVLARPGWTPGNDMVFVISGTGERIAEAYEGNPLAAARLHIEYSTPSPLDPPDEVSPPASVMPLVFTSKTSLAWEDAARSNASTFNVYRGLLDDLMGGVGDCWQEGLVGSIAMEPDLPPSGAAYFYLVSGENAAGEGPLGSDSSGASRLPRSSCP